MKKISLLLVTICAFVNITFGQSISSFTPKSGTAGTVVTLTGEFNAAFPNKNWVYFGSAKANVISATSEQLKVEVPVGATTDYITLMINNQLVTSNTMFGVTFSPIYTPMDSLVLNQISTLNLGFKPSCIASGDFDNDGFIDIAVSCEADTAVYIYKNKNYLRGEIKTSNFEKTTKISASTAISALKVGDVNADGLVDLFILNQNSNSFSVVKNQARQFYLNQTSFAKKVDFTTGSSPRAMYLSDINADKKLDIIVANWNDNTISIYQNNTAFGVFSSNTFSKKFNLVTGDQPIDVVATNVDQYNNVDFIVANSNSNSISVITRKFNSGNLTIVNDTCYEYASLINTKQEPASLSVVDLNNDQAKEIIVTNKGASRISVYRNLAGNILNFADGIELYCNELPQGLAIGDINGDAKVDILVTNTNASNISLYQNNTATSGTISATTIFSKVDMTVGLEPKGILVADFDNDGKPDVATLDLSSNQVTFKRNTIGGTIIVKGSIDEFNLKTSKTSAIQSINVSAKGLGTNKLTITPSGTNVQISLSETSGFSASAISISTTNDSVPQTTIFVRILGSTTKNVYSGKLTFTSTNTLKKEIIFGVRNGIPTVDSVIPSSAKYGEVVSLKGKEFGTNIANAKVDFGGVKAELLTINDSIITLKIPVGATNSKVLLNVSGYQSYTKNAFFPTFENGNFLNQYCFTGPYNYSTLAYPLQLVNADFNNDGKQDLIFNYLEGISFYTNKTNKFTVDSAFKMNNYKSFLSSNINAADIDGDNRTDLILNSNSAVWNIYKNVNNSDSITISNFSTNAQYNALNSRVNFVTTDLNQDGKLDVLVANNGVNSINANTISIYMSKAVVGKIDSTTFSKPFEIVLGEYPSLVFADDINGDNKPEILAITKNNTLSIFQNNMTFGNANASSFGSPYEMKLTDLPSDIEINDIDLDGKLDLVLLMPNENLIKIYRNITAQSEINSLTFASPITLSVIGNPNAIEIADFDGDAFPDITVANYNANSVSLFKNIYSGGNFTSSSFQTKVDYSVGLFPFDVKVVDIDGDGKPEIITTNTGEIGGGGIRDVKYGSISVLRNRVVPNAVGIVNDLVETQFDLYPNPASKSVNVKVSESDKIETVELLELNGNKVLTLNNINTDSVVVDIETISSGMYLVKVITENGVGIKKLLIQ